MLTYNNNLFLLTMRKHAPKRAALIFTSRSIGKEIPKLSASVKASLTIPVHCLAILPTFVDSSTDKTCFDAKKITIYHHDKCLVVCKRITWFYTFITKIKDQVKLSNCHQYFCIVCFVHQSSHQRNICMNRTAPKSSELLLSSHSVWYTWEGKDANSGSHIQSGSPVETEFQAKRKTVKTHKTVI